MKCQVAKLRPVDQVVGWINTVLAATTEEIQGWKEGPYVNLGIDPGPEEPRRKRHFLKWVRTCSAHRSYGNGFVLLSGVGLRFGSGPTFLISTTWTEMLLRGEGQILSSL